MGVGWTILSTCEELMGRSSEGDRMAPVRATGTLSLLDVEGWLRAKDGSADGVPSEGRALRIGWA